MTNQQYAAELKIALELHRSGAVKEAAGMYRAMLSKNPASFDLQHYMGMALLQMKQAADAIPYFNAALKINPQSAAAFCNLGVAQQMAGNVDAALASFDQAIAAKPDFAEAYARKAAALHTSGRLGDAVDAYRAAWTRRPDPGLANNMGAALRDLGRHDEALSAFGDALAAKPDYAAALVNRGNTYRDMARPQDAIADYDRVLAVHPSHPDALMNRARAVEEAAGRALTEDLAEKDAGGIGKTDTFDKKMNKLVSIQPELLDYARGFAANTAVATLEDVRLYVTMKMNDWSLYHTVASVLKKIRTKKQGTLPFLMVFIPCTSEDQLTVGSSYARRYHPTQKPLWIGEKYNHEKIRVAYLSNDFHRHATAYLMAGLFEAHDRENFEWTAFSYGRDDDSEIRHRIKESFDHFFDVQDADEKTIAQMVREREIDILIDLKGYTAKSRIGVLAHRPAPIQVAYLGFPGTTGMETVDYAIVDHHVVPPENERYFSENLAFMPDTYQVTDNKRAIAPQPTRREVGLPEDAFVFCSFNSNYKITPEIFDVWMRILTKTPGSVLWAFKSVGDAENNLRAEAAKRGVDPARLIFAEHMPQDQHLARMACADLFLDTLPCNAHTTASDAMWAGLPLITVPGETFAGRVASSILHAMDLPDLVLRDLQHYEDTAVELAGDPDVLQAIRARIAANRKTAPLFNTTLFARNIESLYKQMYTRHCSGEQPARLTVEN